ncbi:ExbD/TolR family protein [Allosphingosinicella sp.]|jgi:biopolymer transport protein ExbD|uniref:ExbD/TolR family protein n=1 Tax=Allosphingosinicella sp. TaxID=2823234 RepID=UPI002F187C19
MGAGVASDSDEPMMDINTTPLIDVMLVLLIMFIITIPIQSHAVEIDLPVNDPNQPAPPVDPVKNKVVIMPDGLVLWNNSPVDGPTLQTLLERSITMTPMPELHLQPHPEARYSVVDEVLAITKRANVTAMGFVGNEAYGTAF